MLANFLRSKIKLSSSRLSSLQSVKLIKSLNQSKPFFTTHSYNFSTKKTNDKSNDKTTSHSTDDTTTVDTNPSLQFEKQINSVTDTEDNQSMDQYLKTFNDKVYKQNVELTNKLVDIFKDETPSGAKIFTTVNEINKINLNNSLSLLQVFLNQILKYNDSVRLFIQQSEKKNSRYSGLIPLTILFLWACGLVYLYSFYRQNYINYNKTFDMLIKNYNDNGSTSYKIKIKYPILDDHKNVTNFITFDTNRHIVLIGPNSMGKTESVKHYCLRQSLKDIFTVYIDLNSVCGGGENFDIKELVKAALLEKYKNNELSFMMNDENVTFRLFDYLSNRNMCVVFDNYNHSRDEKRVMNSSVPFMKSNINWKSLIVASDNELLEKAVESKLEVRYLNFVQTKAFKSYLVEKLNSYCKKKVEFSNLELFNDDNIMSLYKNFYYFSFDDLFGHLDLNSSVEGMVIIYIYAYFYFYLCL